MAMCPRCRKKAARRYCPALDTTICAVCCARERMLEIACRETCQYLIAGRDMSMKRLSDLRHKRRAAMSSSQPFLTDREIDALLLAEKTIVEAQRETYPDLEDSDVLFAIDNAIRNVETEVSGLIYEHRTPSVRADELSKKVRESLNQRSSEIPHDQRLRRSEILNAFRFLRETVEVLTEKSNPRSYIRHAAQFYPWKTEPEKQIVLA